MFYKLILVCLSILVILFSSISLVFADQGSALFGTKALLVNTGKAAGYDPATNQYSLANTIGGVIYTFLGLLGIIFLVLTVYAGYLWLTAGGDEKKVEDAQKYLKNGVIGMLIVLASFGVTKLIMAYLLQASLST